ncbi:hypothetical protein GQ54DRAFT_295327 [Martensiomyces pterosporus]|nr:hypothetical protein GQ54DRAFT_295327 [Martensiomyces pterosporus]
MDTQDSTGESHPQQEALLPASEVEDFGLVDYESPILEPQVVDSSPEDMASNENDSHNNGDDADTMSDIVELPATRPSDYRFDDNLINYEESDIELEADEDANDGNEDYTTEENDLSLSRDAESDAAAAPAPADSTTSDSNNEHQQQHQQQQQQQPEPPAMDTKLEDVHTIDSSSSDTSDHDAGAVVDLTDDDHVSHSFEQNQVPEVWVHCEGEWMVYLGPSQPLFAAQQQRALFDMPLAELIDALRSDTLLKDDVEMSLEFPSMELTIDKRDEESFGISLSQLYNGHVAAVSLGRLPLDLVSSAYFVHSSSSTASEHASRPSPESFAFIIHTRRAVQSSLTHIMQTIDEYHSTAAAHAESAEDAVSATATATAVNENHAAEPVELGTAPADTEETAEAEDEPVADADAPAEEQYEREGEDEGGHVEAAESGATTADLLADAQDEDDADDVDYVAGEEEEDDHVIEADGRDAEDDDDDEDLDAEEYEDAADIDAGDMDDALPADGAEDDVDNDDEHIDGAETRVDSPNASPTNKRTQDVRSGTDDLATTDDHVAKKPRSEDSVEADEDSAAAAAAIDAVV